MPRRSMPRRRGGIRVIAGTAGGLSLVTPAIARPTTDRVKESLFGRLEHGPGLADRRVLDLYAGSGSLAIEALSRGAARALLVERDHDAVTAIWQNLATTGFTDRARVVVRGVDVFLRAGPPADAPFDLVVLDPPYAEDDTPAVLTHLLRPGWLSEDAVVVIERASRAAPLELPEVLVLAWERRYGDTLLTVVNYTTTGNISDSTTDSTTDSPRDSPTDREG